jgi:hypothetical protein
MFKYIYFICFHFVSIIMVPGTHQSSEKFSRFVLQQQKLQQHVYALGSYAAHNLFLTTQSLISLGLNRLAMTTGGSMQVDSFFDPVKHLFLTTQSLISLGLNHLAMTTGGSMQVDSFFDPVKHLFLTTQSLISLGLNQLAMTMGGSMQVDSFFDPVKQRHIVLSMDG